MATAPNAPQGPAAPASNASPEPELALPLRLGRFLLLKLMARGGMGEVFLAATGDIEGAEYLPLKGTMVAGSYLLHGRWPEYWTFDACHEQVPVKVTFEADGWSGSSFTAVHNKGD